MVSKKLDEGFQSKVGESGSNISGGQMQELLQELCIKIKF